MSQAEQVNEWRRMDTLDVPDEGRVRQLTVAGRSVALTRCGGRLGALSGAPEGAAGRPVPASQVNRDPVGRGRTGWRPAPTHPCRRFGRAPPRRPGPRAGPGTAWSKRRIHPPGGEQLIVRDERGYVTSATPERTSGYILTRFADKYGRAVATAFAPSPRSAGCRHGDRACGGM